MTRERKTMFTDWSETESHLVLAHMGTGPLLVDLELAESMGAARVMPPGPEEILRKGKWRGYRVRYAGVMRTDDESESALGLIRFADGCLELRQILVAPKVGGFLIDARWSPTGGLRVSANGLESVANEADGEAFLRALPFVRQVMSNAERAARARSGLVGDITAANERRAEVSRRKAEGQTDLRIAREIGLLDPLPDGSLRADPLRSIRRDAARVASRTPHKSRTD